MKVIIWAIVISLIAISCETEPTTTIDGNYQGLYYITHNYGTDSSRTLQGNITFEFSHGEYKYTGETYSLPPESSGEYWFAFGKLYMKDNGRHNANIDLTLLLNGEFNCFFDGEKMTLTQEVRQFKYFHRIILNKK